MIVSYQIYIQEDILDYKVGLMLIYTLFCSRDSLTTLENLTELVHHMNTINKCVM